MLRPPAPPLLPYTTHFRSWAGRRNREGFPVRAAPTARRCPARPRRSEEHTSELQSRENLVCRLLLEKKNQFRRKLARLDIAGGGRPVGGAAAVRVPADRRR